MPLPIDKAYLLAQLRNFKTIILDPDFKIQKTELPTASEDNEGAVFQYVGTDTTNYTIGGFYQCQEVTPVTNPPTYHWVAVSKGSDDTFTGATATTDGKIGMVVKPLAGDQDKVLQGNGTFGKKLQTDIVKQNDAYGYVNDNDTFVPFKSQADIDAAVAAARVGTATAADVLSGKTFTNSSASGLTGTFAGQEKTVTATNSTIAVTPDSGKWLSKVNVNPKLPFQVGRLSTRKNIDGWNDTWSAKTWNGLTSFYGAGIWTDGNDIYCSSGRTQYVLDKSTSTWSEKTWSGLTSFSGSNVWTDGDNIYYSDDRTQYVLDKSTSTWSAKTWSGMNNFLGAHVWSDGTNIYYSDGSTQKVLNKATSTWSNKTWSGMNEFLGVMIWSDGTNIYYSLGSTQKVLNKSTSTWSNKTWSGWTDFMGYYIWTDGNDIYLSIENQVQYVLNKSTSTWSNKTWSGSIIIAGSSIWSDGYNIYYSEGSAQYVLNRAKTHWVV